MARAICGVYERGKAAADAGVIDVVLDALPGQGRAERTNPEDAVSFGCRELRADAAEADAPPAWRAARGLTVAADARLDYRSELLDAFGLAGPERAGATDAELILRAYERWGEECPRRLYGDFAFALWDSGKRLLFCARDAVGVRPFFYSRGPGRRFVFASDTAAALAAPGVDDDLDEAEAAAYLMGRPMGSGGTFFRGVRSLPPGHSIAAGAETERVRRWWRPEDAPPVVRESDEDYEREFLKIYGRAVRERLRDAHPLGVHLSGGLDSSSIAVLAARELRPSGRRPHALCWHPPPDDSLAGEEAAEYDLIESVCAQEGLQPLYHQVSNDHILATLRRDAVQSCDRDGTMMHETLVQRTAAELGVRVILSGWGGDEVASYGGAGYYVELLRGGLLRRLWREARGLSNRPWRFVTRHAVLPQLHFGGARFVAKLLRGEMPRRRKSFLHPDLLHRHEKRSRASLRVLGVRREQLKRLISGHLAQRMEDWAAHGARVGVEYRYPLLDRRLIEFVLGLPAEQFRRGVRSRGLMRRAMRSVLPPDILELSEKRDPARLRPVRTAFAEDALPVILPRLHSRNEPPARAEYIDMPRLREHLEALVAGEPGYFGKASRALKFLDWHKD